MHLRFPLETYARKRRAARQLEFARHARLALRNTENIRFEPSEQGLKILAADEDALLGAAQVLRELYGDFVEIDPPGVRLLPGHPVQQPVASVRISTRDDFTVPVRAELAARGTTILEEVSRARAFVLRGEAPLADMLGLPARLATLTRGNAVHWIRLSHYAPILSPPGGYAA